MVTTSKGGVSYKEKYLSVTLLNKIISDVNDINIIDLNNIFSVKKLFCLKI